MPTCPLPYPVPKVQKEMFKQEVENQSYQESLNQQTIQNGQPHPLKKPIPKSNQVHFLSEFRNLNKQLNQKQYPMPKINEILLKLERFYYATSLDLNMGFIISDLDESTSNLCTISIMRGEYRYKCLPMVVTNSSEMSRVLSSSVTHESH